ncbi:MAG: hypothetical protein FJ316_06010 [SAR202 cluster bacterium]|nr:hypothetical protein [SAR202 cluster bacterium]
MARCLSIWGLLLTVSSLLAACATQVNPTPQGQLPTSDPRTPTATLQAHTRIVFTSILENNTDIYVMDADGTNLTRLTDHPAMECKPAWSPDGSKIVFFSNRDGNFEIYTMNADGSSVTRLTHNAASDANPAWSPDGRKIAFSSDRDGNFEIYSMNPDGSEVQRLTNSTASEIEVAWSPDGQRVVYASSEITNSPRLYMMDVLGGNQTEPDR